MATTAQVSQRYTQTQYSLSSSAAEILRSSSNRNLQTRGAVASAAESSGGDVEMKRAVGARTEHDVRIPKLTVENPSVQHDHRFP